MAGIRTGLAALVLACQLVAGGTAAAQTLTVVDETGAEPVIHELTLEDVEALAPTVEITTGTVWTDSEGVYSGIPTSAIAELIAGPYEQIEATALNDFSVLLPVSDFDADSGIIIATRADGEPMSVRDRGPFWLMFDFDALSATDRTTAEQRAIWQMNRLTFR